MLRPPPPSPTPSETPDATRSEPVEEVEGEGALTWTNIAARLSEFGVVSPTTTTNNQRRPETRMGRTSQGSVLWEAP